MVLSVPHAATGLKLRANSSLGVPRMISPKRAPPPTTQYLRLCPAFYCHLLHCRVSPVNKQNLYFYCHLLHCRVSPVKKQNLYF
jgi:hypothetical protein